MAECLILGQAGIGKTSLVVELQYRGRVAYDADDIDRVPGLSGWFDANGQPCMYNNNPEWRANHRFLWDLGMVRGLIEQRDHTQSFYFAGTAHNDLQAVRFFSQTVALDADIETLCRRHAAENRTTPYPSDDAVGYRAWLTEVMPGLRVAWRALGVTVLNTTELSTSQVVDQLIAFVEGDA